MEPLVTICVPHHAGWYLLRDLLTSLRKIRPETPAFRILVVDNASQDGSRELMHQQFPETQILEMGTNTGFAPALNRAAEVSETPWLAFLNNDMRVHPGWLVEAFKIAESHKTGCVGCRILSWDGAETQFAGGEINLLGKGFEWNDEDVGVEEERALLFPCGGAMLIRRDLFLDSGGFDADYEMIYEDIDLGWRLNLFGHAIRYAPKSIVYHRRHASLARVAYAQKAIYLERNSLATMYKNLASENWAAVMPELMRLAIHRTESMPTANAANYDHLRGIQAFFDDLPKWREKRKKIQRERRVSDDAIQSRFFARPDRLWAYADEHREALCSGDYLRIRTPILEKISSAIGLRTVESGDPSVDLPAS